MSARYSISVHHKMIWSGAYLLIGSALISLCGATCTFPSTIDDKLTLSPSGKTVYAYDELVKFGCPPGNKLIGNPVLKCTEGDWDGEPPLCLNAAERYLLDEVKLSIDTASAIQRSLSKIEATLAHTKDAIKRIHSRIDYLEKAAKSLTTGKCYMGRGLMRALVCDG